MCAADDIDKTDEPAAAVAKRIPGADFEPGPGSPLNPDGSLRWSARDAAGRFATETIRNERAEAARRTEAAVAVWWTKEDEG